LGQRCGKSSFSDSKTHHLPLFERPYPVHPHSPLQLLLVVVVVVVVVVVLVLLLHRVPPL
jgi:hypothetical protein